MKYQIGKKWHLRIEVRSSIVVEQNLHLSIKNLRRKISPRLLLSNLVPPSFAVKRHFRSTFRTLFHIQLGVTQFMAGTQSHKRCFEEEP